MLLNNISENEWERLFEVMIKFRDKKCWNWLADNMIFGVENIETGETGYCSVMGNSGISYGLAVYRGPEGIKALQELMSGKGEEDLSFSYNTLLAMLMDREELDKVDYNLIRSLNLRFRGKNNWPAFRSHTPNYYPEFLKRSELRFLTTVLEQVLIVAEKVKGNIEKYFFNDKYYIRVPEEKKDGEIVWKGEFRSPEIFAEEKPQTLEVDDFTLRKIKNNYQKTNRILLIDRNSLPQPVKEKEDERPYFPYVIFFVDYQSEFILHFNMVHPANLNNQVVEELIRVIEDNELLPGEIIVSKNDIFNKLKLVCERLDINLSLKRNLPLLEEMKEELFGFMN